MHTILERQLRRLRASLSAVPVLETWQAFLAQVDRAYNQGDQDRYLLERSLAISSKEMQDLYAIEREEAEERLNVTEGKYRSLFDNAFDSIFIIDAHTRKILDVNSTASERLGYSRGELLGMTIDNLYPPEELEDNFVRANELIERGSLVFQRTHIRKDGSRLAVEISSKHLRFEGADIFQSIVRDITDRKQAEEELKRMATHDALTGLPNRVLFDDRLAHAVEIGRRSGKILAVMFIDLDGFKAVNDAFGHRAGDRLLETISQRIAGCVRQSDTVARFGGDEFAVLLESISRPSEILPIAEKIIAAVAQPFVVNEAEAFITTSMGISLFPLDGEDPDSLVQNADRAMYLCKAEETNSYRFFKPAMKTQAQARLELGNQLRHAIERKEFSMVYQPQVDSKTNKVVALEALARWNHPERGVLMPEVFIPIAEETGLIGPLSEWVLTQACTEMRKLLSGTKSKAFLAINLSHRDLNHMNLVEKIEQALKVSKLPPEALELELSENTIFRDMHKSRVVLDEIKELGVRLAIDDFGVGYSTLSQLAWLPFDTLKIDRQFATRLPSSPNDLAIVNGIIAIARSLKVDIVAEGVETQEQLDLYESLGCHRIQGWLYAEAAPANKMKTMLTRGVKRKVPKPKAKAKAKSKKSRVNRSKT
jgi:diguanylate cyclase (GGDEF)-like protein/PAS domain S-box-containing protein